MSLPSGFGGGGSYSAGKGDKQLSLDLAEMIRLAWADPDLRARITFVLMMFGVFALGVNVPVPIPGLRSEDVASTLQGTAFDLINTFGGGALKKLSIFSLGLNPYITASIIIQILYTAVPKWKQEMQDGGEYARKQQNKKTRGLAVALCLIQGWGLLQLMASSSPLVAGLALQMKVITILFWTAGAMFMLWLGEQISERGIGNGVSLMIFAGIILAMPNQIMQLVNEIKVHSAPVWSPIVIIGVFLVATWFIVYFTTAQRRIPIQHMRRTVGTRMVGGSTSYLPLSVNMAGVMPIIFAVSLIGLPYQFAMMLGGPTKPAGKFLTDVADWLNPNSIRPERAILAAVIYTALIFFFTYFWTAIQYNVEDISNNLKRNGSFIPGVRPGKQTKDFLDGVISRITVVGAAFISVVALIQYIAPRVSGIEPNRISMVGGTSLLIMVSVALETMRQIEANLLMKQYNQ